MCSLLPLRLHPSPFTFQYIHTSTGPCIIKAQHKIQDIYADDLQIYIPLKSNDEGNCNHLLSCISQIKDLINPNFLQLSWHLNVINIFGEIQHHWWQILCCIWHWFWKVNQHWYCDIVFKKHIYFWSTFISKIWQNTVSWLKKKEIARWLQVKISMFQFMGICWPFYMYDVWLLSQFWNIDWH